MLFDHTENFKTSLKNVCEFQHPEYVHNNNFNIPASACFQRKVQIYMRACAIVWHNYTYGAAENSAAALVNNFRPDSCTAVHAALLSKQSNVPWRKWTSTTHKICRWLDLFRGSDLYIFLSIKCAIVRWHYNSSANFANRIKILQMLKL